MAIGERCLLSNIYAPTDISRKSNLWAHISYIRALDPFLPWILAGDFNSVTSLDEKHGEVARLDPFANLFRDMIDSLNLIDVKPTNGVFTWNNRRCGAEAISETVGRFFFFLLLDEQQVDH